MTFDIHVHLLGHERVNGNRAALDRVRSLAGRSMMRQLGFLVRGQGVPTDDAILAKTVEYIDESPLDRVVLLALDWVHREDGAIDRDRTIVATDNDYVVRAAQSSDKILIGASIHPYRRDAVAELERLADLGACLVKWIPSAQYIRVDDPACYRFYDAMARLGIPLLCHTGVEHIIPGSSSSLNDPRRLEGALVRGVTVIAAHIGAPMTLYEPSYIHHWARLTRQYRQLFGDISALAVPLRVTILKILKRRKALCSRMIYGSDYPHAAWPLLLAHHLGARNALRLAGIVNPLEKTYSTVKRLGLPDEVFSRAGEVLRVPPPR